MITGAHMIIFTTNPEADRAFLRDVIHLPYVDAGDGWLIFGLPPAEMAFHPHEQNNVHELYLICEDVEELIGDMNQRGVACDPIMEAEWGRLTRLQLPGGGKLGIYQPTHARPVDSPRD